MAKYYFHLEGSSDFYQKGYLNVLSDSPNEVLAGLMFAIIAVLEFPPKLSLSNLQSTRTMFIPLFHLWLLNNC